MNDRDKIIKFAFEEIKKRITDEKISIPDSLSFCSLVLDKMPNNREYIIKYFNNNYNEVLSEVVSQNDFIKALKIFDLFLVQNNETSKMILEKTADRIIVSLRNMPDDLWKVRVLSQLSKNVLNMVMPKLSKQEINGLLYICPQAVNFEIVEEVGKLVLDSQEHKKKLILRKKK